MAGHTILIRLDPILGHIITPANGTTDAGLAEIADNYAHIVRAYQILAA